MNEWLAVKLANVEGVSLIPPSWLHRDIPVSQLLREGLKVAPEDVTRWDLRMADSVSFEPTRDSSNAINGYTQIVAVSGVDAEISRQRPDFMTDFVEGVRLGYARHEIAIDAHGSRNMRLMRMLAPIGRGVFGLITGPSDSGKTWLIRDLTGPLLGEETNARFVVVDVGERGPDVQEHKAILAEHDGSRVEHYHGFQTNSAINSCVVARERVYRLAELGHDVYFLLDSLWGLVLTLARMGVEGGYAGKGVPTAAIDLAKMFLFAGTIEGGGSVTVIATSLDEGEGSRSRVVLEEVGWQNATMRWMLRREAPATPRPWIDVRETRTREIEHLLGGEGSERYRLHQEIIHRIWERGGPRQALDYAIELASVPGTWDEAVQVWRERWAKEDAEAARYPKREERRGREERPTEPAASVEDIVAVRDRLVGEGLDLPVIGAFLAAQIARKGYSASQVEELLREVAVGERQLSELYT